MELEGLDKKLEAAELKLEMGDIKREALDMELEADWALATPSLGGVEGQRGIRSKLPDSSLFLLLNMWEWVRVIIFFARRCGDSVLSFSIFVFFYQ